mgnify:CR=1 FL=1
MNTNTIPVFGAVDAPTAHRRAFHAAMLSAAQKAQVAHIAVLRAERLRKEKGTMLRPVAGMTA